LTKILGNSHLSTINSDRFDKILENFANFLVSIFLKKRIKKPPDILKSSFVTFKVTNYNGCAKNIEKRDTSISEKREGTTPRSNSQLICLKIKTHLMKMEGGKIHTFFLVKKTI
jgi:hypothetical protein